MIVDNVFDILDVLRKALCSQHTIFLFFTLAIEIIDKIITSVCQLSLDFIYSKEPHKASKKEAQMFESIPELLARLRYLQILGYNSSFV